MAFSPFPQAWLGAAYREEQSIAITCTIATNKLTIPGVALSQFLAVNDPVYFTSTLGTMVANTIQYIAASTVSGSNTELTFASIPSFAGTPVARTFASGGTITLYIPKRIWLTTETTGITGVPEGLSTLSAANAARATGDIRYLYLELNKMLKRLWDAKVTADRPARVRMDSHEFIADGETVSRNYITEVDLSYATATIEAE